MRAPSSDQTAYGFREAKTAEVALFHTLGNLPEPVVATGSAEEAKIRFGATTKFGAGSLGGHVAAAQRVAAVASDRDVLRRALLEDGVQELADDGERSVVDARPGF